MRSTMRFLIKFPRTSAAMYITCSELEDVPLWTNLTTISSSRHGPATTGCLQIKVRLVAKSADINLICREGVIKFIHEQLDNTNAVDETSQLDGDLADALDYYSRREASVSPLISDFYLHVDKPLTLRVRVKPERHLLLSQGELEFHE